MGAVTVNFAVPSSLVQQDEVVPKLARISLASLNASNKGEHIRRKFERDRAKMLEYWVTIKY